MFELFESGGCVFVFGVLMFEGDGGDVGEDVGVEVVGEYRF